MYIAYSTANKNKLTPTENTSGSLRQPQAAMPLPVKAESRHWNNQIQNSERNNSPLFFGTRLLLLLLLLLGPSVLRRNFCAASPL
jgi:hypothetical protein